MNLKTLEIPFHVAQDAEYSKNLVDCGAQIAGNSFELPMKLVTTGELLLCSLGGGQVTEARPGQAFQLSNGKRSQIRFSITTLPFFPANPNKIALQNQR